jgi:hypothetical protein
MTRYLLLKFERDDEFSLFHDDLDIMLAELSNPPYAVEIVGEAKPELFHGLTRLYKVAPVE